MSKFLIEINNDDLHLIGNNVSNENGFATFYFDSTTEMIGCWLLRKILTSIGGYKISFSRHKENGILISTVRTNLPYEEWINLKK